ncbi:hypothetical protein LSAT2_016331 [Lamellibrachia satsuma]|nr:hypothetical protein LSAT2_016331 [Lamellibrachia satsuma]
MGNTLPLRLRRARSERRRRVASAVALNLARIIQTILIQFVCRTNNTEMHIWRFAVSRARHRLRQIRAGSAITHHFHLEQTCAQHGPTVRRLAPSTPLRGRRNTAGEETIGLQWLSS